MTRFTPFAGALLLASTLAACAHRGPLPTQAEPSGPYRIGCEDLLDIAVWRDPDLSRTVPVRPDGRISLPLVGELEAADKSAEQLAEEIAEKLRPFVLHPRVTVVVREVNAPRVFVLGEVARPGAYPMRARLTVLQALALAGGPSEYAAISRMVVIRGDKPERYVVDFKRQVKQGSELELMPGDTLYVP